MFQQKSRKTLNYLHLLQKLRKGKDILTIPSREADNVIKSLRLFYEDDEKFKLMTGSKDYVSIESKQQMQTW